MKARQVTLDKIVIIINGKGGVGKDTLCEIACQHFAGINISSITPIKEIASLGGWAGEKEEKSRRLLSKLKEAFSEYNDLPFSYLMEQYREFLHSNSTILFVHIREAVEIDKFKASVDVTCVTLLIQRHDRQGDPAGTMGNSSDDLVGQYEYDYYFANSYLLSELESPFIAFLSEVLKERGIVPQRNIKCIG